jgi:hypothetical protein
MAAVLATLAVARAGADAFDAIGDTLRRLGLFEGMQISGHGEFSLRGDFTSGSREAYESQFWNTGTAQAQTSFDLSGPIWRKFGLRAHITNTGYGYNDNRFMFGWQDARTALLWGDLSVQLSGNEFASYTKSLKGWQFDQRLGGNLLLHGFTSKEKGLVRRQTILGNNTSGPYFLTYTPIVEGTELVKVDERPQKFGEDYTLDYDTGQLYFEPPGKAPRIIPSTSTISVSYQSATNYEAGGETRGMQVEGSLLGGDLQLYLTRLENKSGAGGASDTARFQDDIFQGSGSTGPFDVRYSPILADGAKAVINGQEQIVRDALIVLMDNVEQREGVDFDAIRQIGRIIFRHIVPPTAVVRIKYYYQVGPDQSQLGDSAVTGLALRHKFSDALTWDLAFARSDAVTGASAGNALSASARWQGGQKLDANVQYRAVDPTFRYLDSVGFFRNERGLNAAIGYRPLDGVTFSHTFSDVKTNSGYTYGYSGYSGYYGYDRGFSDLRTADDGGPASLDTRAMRNDSQLSVTFPGWPSLNLSRQSMVNSGGSAGDSSYDTLNLNLDYSPEKLPMTFRASFIDTAQDYAGTVSDDDEREAQSSRTQSLNLAYSWTPSDRLSFATNWGQNTSRSAYKSQHGDSSNFQVSARWQPIDRLDLNFDWTQTESLGAVTSGFYGGGIGFGGYVPGYNYGYPGNPGGRPYSLTEALRAAADTDPDEEEPDLNQYTDSSMRLGLAFQPTSKISLDANLGLRKYTSGGSIGYLADSDQRYGNLSVSWLPTQDLAFNLSVGSDLLQFLDAGRGGVLNNSLMFGANYRPENSRWSYGLSLNRQWGVSPDYGTSGDGEVAELVDTELLDAQLNLEYRLASRARLAARLGFSDFKGGFADFAKQTADIGLQYQLSNAVALNLGYQFIANDSRLSSTSGTDSPIMGGQDYTTHLMVFSLSTNFQSTVAGAERDAGLNQPRQPGYGMFGGYGTGYGGGFGAGLRMQQPTPSYSRMFGGGYNSPLSGSGFGSSYGGYGYFGGSGSGFSSGGFGGSGGYYGGGGFGGYSGGSRYGSGFGGYTGGGFGGGGSMLGSYSSGFGGSGGGLGGYEEYGGPGSYGSYGGYDSGAWGGLTGVGSSGSYGGWGSTERGASAGGPQAPQPEIGDPWSQGGTEVTIDDLRDV